MKISKNVLIPLILLVVVVSGGGYYLWHAESHKAGKMVKTEQGEQGPVQYTCPMHPFIVKDKPGACPICGMNLVPVKKGAATEGGKDASTLGQVSLSPSQMVMANVVTVEARVQPIVREISAVGIIQYDQARQARVTAWVAGRIDRLFVNRVGDYVSTKHPVALLYSPDLVSAQQEYLLALKSREEFRDSPIQSISQGGEGLVASARQRLKLLGVKDEQIALLERGEKPDIRIPIYTPLSGVVIEKIVQQGQYVNGGDPLFNIADLSTVWAELEVYENDFPLIRIGQRVEITSQSYPGKGFGGRVAFIYPFLDPKSRTVKVRVELANPGARLKPDMFVNATVKAPLGSSLAVPASAVIDTGKRHLVWVEAKAGVFTSRDVKAGVKTGDSIQILSGLQAGEKVAVSGGYLIDSEAQLKGGGGGHEAMPGMKMEEKGTLKPAEPAPKKPSMNMDDMKM
ncbi:MAG TPA: efflux RND transporter periplasmic adaptor subunit [Geobacteraceae bacterium]|nr:efflux RND transporter periplasmic adaptor subunit [Geobacteraceae bacterium]